MRGAVRGVGGIGSVFHSLTHLVHLCVTTSDPVIRWELYVNPIITPYRVVQRLVRPPLKVANSTESGQF